MEDRYNVAKDLAPDAHLFAVYDGHGDGRVSGLLSTYVPTRIAQGLLQQQQQQKKDVDARDDSRAEIDRVLAEALQSVDDMGERMWGATEDGSPPQLTGSTACLALLIDRPSGERDLHLANVGDSRAILCVGSGSAGGKNKNRAVQLTRDHKPGEARELTRITKAGGFVSKVFGIHRVMGSLSLSRALGDWHLRPYVVPTPDAFHRQLHGEELYLILATDGLWDVLKNEEVCNIADRVMQMERDVESAGSKLPFTVSRALVEEAKRRGSGDNITVMWVDLRGEGASSPSGVVVPV